MLHALHRRNDPYLTRYVPKPQHPGVVGDPPRMITHAEIEDIVLAIPPPVGLTDEIVELSHLYIQQHERDKLTGKYVSPQAIPLIKTSIINKYKSSQVKPGKPMIGIEEAFSQPAMQATLNTFHKAGGINETGFEALKEVLYIPARRKNELIFMHFKRSMTREKIFSLRGDLVYHTIGDLIEEMEIEKIYDLEDYWWSEMQRKIYRIEASDDTYIMRIHLDTTMMAAHNIKMNEIATKIAEGLRVDVIMSPLEEGIIDIYARYEVIEGTEALHVRSMGENPNRSTLYQIYYNRCVRPFLDTTQISGIEGTYSLHAEEVPILSAILSTFKLTDGQKEFLPESKYGADRVQQDLWYIRKKLQVCTFMGVSDRKIKSLLQSSAVGIKILSIDRFQLLVKLPDEARGLTPIEYISAKIAEIESALVMANAIRAVDDDVIEKASTYADSMIEPGLDEHLRETAHENFVNDFIDKTPGVVDESILDPEAEVQYNDKGLFLDERSRKIFQINKVRSIFDILKSPATSEENRDVEAFVSKMHQLKVQQILENFMESTVHRYAVVSSIALKDILKLKYVDRTRTYSNNFYVMASTFGIEAARAYHLYNMQMIMNATGETIEQRYMLHFSDIISQRGVPIGINFTGVTSKAGGFYSLSTVQQSGKILTDSALYNTSGESTKAVSASILIGDKPFIGTGAYDYGVKFEPVNPNDIETGETANLDDLDDLLAEEDLPPPAEIMFDQGEGENISNRNMSRLIAERERITKAPSKSAPVKPISIPGLDDVISNILAGNTNRPEETIVEQIVDAQYDEEPSIISATDAMTLVPTTFTVPPGIPDVIVQLMSRYLEPKEPKEPKPAEETQTSDLTEEPSVSGSTSDFSIPDIPVHIPTIRKITPIDTQSLLQY